MSAWYEDWFNSDEYLTVYSHRDQQEADEFAATINKLVSIPEHSRILDLACGAGRHAIAFAKLGYDVTAVDLSSRLLEIGSQSAAESGVKVNFQRANLLHFKSSPEFSVVLNVFTSFGYFAEDADNFRIFSIAHEALLRAGLFIFDYMNVEFVRKNFVPHSIDSIGDSIIEQTRSISKDRVNKSICIKSGGKARVFTESVKLYSAETLQTALADAGFRDIRLLGDYSGGKFEADSSSRFIAICKKA